MYLHTPAIKLFIWVTVTYPFLRCLARALLNTWLTITNETIIGIQLKGDTEMRTATLEQTHTIINITSLFMLLCLIFPYISAAELQPMSETELKSVVLTDVAGPVDILILKTVGLIMINLTRSRRFLSPV
jgi:hypothetical protein